MPNKNPKLAYHLLFCMAMVFVGSFVIVGKELTNNLPVFFIVGVRLFVTTIAFYAIIKIRKEKIPKYVLQI